MCEQVTHISGEHRGFEGANLGRGWRGTGDSGVLSWHRYMFSGCVCTQHMPRPCGRVGLAGVSLRGGAE